MAQVIPSYRIASAIKIMKWRPFTKLLHKQGMKKFDDMLTIPNFIPLRELWPADIVTEKLKAI